MAINLEISKPEIMSGLRLNSKEQLLDVSVFLFLIVPSLALSFFAVK